MLSFCQFFRAGMFLSGPWFAWIWYGNWYSVIRHCLLTDPLMTLQFASGLPATALDWCAIITVLYALAGKRLFAAGSAC